MPPEKKKLNTHIYMVLYSRFLIEIILLYGLIVAISLVAANQILLSNLGSIRPRTTDLEPVYNQINKEIQKVNKDLKNIDEAQNSFFAWTPFLIETLKNLPTGIFLNGIDFNKENKNLIVQGMAKTRADLLILKDNLTKLQWVKKIDLPSSTLTAKENINFIIDIEMNLL
jgi:Tfp pilus assembly protein PilN